MQLLATPIDMIRYFGAEEMAERSGHELLPQVSGPLFYATCWSHDRSQWTPAERDNADLALVRLTQVLHDASDFVMGFLRAAMDLNDPDLVFPAAVRRATADVGRYQLYDDGWPDDIRRRYDQQLDWLQDVRDGKQQITETASTSSSMRLWRLERS